MDSELLLTLTAVIKVIIVFYIGNFRDDKLHGPGKFTWKDGKIYEGNFKDTKMHGRGKIFYPNGQAVEGFWEDDHNVSLDAVHQAKYEKQSSKLY